MAAAAPSRMRGTVQAKLPPKPGIQVPTGLARPLVLAVLLASVLISSGKGGAAAGRAQEDGEGLGTCSEAGPAGEPALRSVRSWWRSCVEGQGLYGPEKGG